MNKESVETWKAMKTPGSDDQDCTNCIRNFSPDETLECNNCYHVTGWDLYPDEITALSGNYWSWDEGIPRKNPYE